METKIIENQQPSDDCAAREQTIAAAAPSEDISAEETPRQSEETPAPAQPTPELFDRRTVERLVAEAEERGYKRGLDAQAERLLNRPRLYETPSRDHVREEVLILNNPRCSVWDD